MSTITFATTPAAAVSRVIGCHQVGFAPEPVTKAWGGISGRGMEEVNGLDPLWGERKRAAVKSFVTTAQAATGGNHLGVGGRGPGDAIVRVAWSLRWLRNGPRRGLAIRAARRSHVHGRERHSSELKGDGRKRAAGGTRKLRASTIFPARSRGQRRPLPLDGPPG